MLFKETIRLSTGKMGLKDIIANCFSPFFPVLCCLLHFNVTYLQRADSQLQGLWQRIREKEQTKENHSGPTFRNV